MLRSHGGILQKSRDFDERMEKIKEYRQKMQSFAEFLKDAFLGSGPFEDDGSRQEF
jgi:hypothetical protein